ncbi:MAG TPA: IS1595 family transposase [Gammaproteobacteria bacterium]|nr:IS1595 family transposase [Gammaproteobacteria bacterium]
MAANPIQFQRGLSLAEFLCRYGDEASCERALFEARWPRGFVCPQCEATAHSTFVRAGRRYWQCSACHHQTSLRAGTVFDNTKLALTQWFLAIYLLTQSKTNMAALELARHLGVCYRSAWRMKHKLMEAMRERETSRRLDGFVEIDDAYLGGERNGGKRGRGSENKRPFVIAVSTDEAGRPGTAVNESVNGFTTAALTDWAHRRLAPGAEVYSDGLSAFRAVVPLGHAHTVIDAGGGRAATEVEGARWVNIALGHVKRALDGTYHAFRFAKYAERYLGEAAWRFNRRFRLEALVPRALVAAARCPAWSERQLRDVPVFGC